MTDREKAIQFCTDYLGSYGKVHEPTPKLTPALVIAMHAALRAEAERENGCEKCIDMEDGDAVYTHSSCDGGYVVEWQDCHYCYNCGRKLDGGGQDARKGESRDNA